MDNNKVIYNNQVCTYQEMVNRKNRERKGFMAGSAGAFGYTKEEYNVMIGQIRQNVPGLAEVAAAYFPFATDETDE